MDDGDIVEKAETYTKDLEDMSDLKLVMSSIN